MMGFAQVIEQKRKDLIQVTQERKMSDPLVVKISQELDVLIYLCQIHKEGDKKYEHTYEDEESQKY